MPIIRNLKKDFDEGRMDKLRSLTYEERGTKAPYITKSEGSSSNEITKRIDDASRIAQMLIDKPGLKHLANEALLKQGDITQKLQSNEKYQQGTKVGNIIRRAGGTLKHVAQVAGSTLAQVPVNGTGTHFLRAFRTDTYLQDGDPVSGFAEFFGAGGVEGSQYALRGEKVPAQGVITNSKLPSRNTTASPGEIGKYHIGIESDLTTETDISLYTPDLTYTTTDTLTNVNNVNNGQSVGKPADLRRNTTPSPGSLGIDKKNIVGDVTENVSTSNYRPDTPYTETTTVANIVNATVGLPINNPSGTGEFDQTFAIQTTSLEGTFGISNKAIEGDISDPLPERSRIITFDSGQLEAGGGRTATSTQDNINRSRVGARIPLLGAPTRPLDVYAQNGIVTLFNLGDEQFKKYITTGYAPVELRTKLIDLNTGEDGVGIGTITSLSKQFEQKFSDLEGARFLLQSTEYNSIAAQTGVPISNKNIAENSPFETTALRGSIPTSTTNRGVQGDITELNPKFENKYNDGGRGYSYLAHSTLTNINNIQSGIEFIDTAGDVKPADGTVPIRSNSWIDGIKYTSKRIKDTRVQGNVNSINLEGEYFSGNAQGGISTFDQTKSRTAIQDFRSHGQTPGIPKATDNYSKFRTYNVYALDYTDRLINKETRVGLGNPGKLNRNRISYTVQDEDTRDKINYLDVSTKPLNGITENRDLIQLEFQILTPEQTYYLAFRAFLDTFDDSFNASWNSSKYLGRADNFYTYGGFERSINIGFKIAAQTREEMKPLYRKAATLASVTAPTYGQGGRFMRGSLAKVTVGDYIYEQPGIIESVQYTWQKDYPWEISFQNPEGNEKSQILPHVLDVSLSFKVIHDFLPETGTNPFITNYRPIQENKEKYIELQNREFIIPETQAEKREKAAIAEAKAKEDAAKAEIAASDQALIQAGAAGPLQSAESYNALGGDTAPGAILRPNPGQQVAQEVSAQVNATVVGPQLPPG